MKWPCLITLVLITQNSFSQIDITSVTGFTFKQTRKEVMEQVKPHGRFIEESLLDEKSLGVKGLRLLGYLNDMVIFSFYDDQLYNIGITIENKDTSELSKIHEILRSRLLEKYGDRFFADNRMEFWLGDWANPLSDKVIITRKPNEMIIQFIHGHLMDLAHPEHRKNALEKTQRKNI